MITTAQTAAPQETIAIELPGLSLSGEIITYLNNLASHNRQTPLSLVVRVHPLNISESLAREFAAHEGNLRDPAEKIAAHECADPHHSHETAIARLALSNLIAEMTAPLADATLAHHLLFILTIGKNLPQPHAVDRMAVCASFDSTHGILHQRFAPDRELAPPDKTIIPAGMTLVCEPVETGYYRLPDDKRYRNGCGLLQGDALYRWTEQAVLMFHTAQAALNKGTPDEREVLIQLGQQIRTLFRLLALQNPTRSHLASFGGLDVSALLETYYRDLEKPAATEINTTEKIVSGRFANLGSASPIRNFEHRAGDQMLDRNRMISHHPDQHLHLQKTELSPE